MKWEKAAAEEYAGRQRASERARSLPGEPATGCDLALSRPHGVLSPRPGPTVNRRGSPARPVCRGRDRFRDAMKLGRDVLRCGERPSHAHGPTAARAHRDVDAKDPGQQRHTGPPRRSCIMQLSVKQACGGREFDEPARDKQRQLLGRGRRFLSARHHRRTQCVVGRQRWFGRRLAPLGRQELGWNCSSGPVAERLRLFGDPNEAGRVRSQGPDQLRIGAAYGWRLGRIGSP